MTDDERLLAELGRAMRAAAEVPAGFIAAGKSAFTWHDVDAELAELAYDSARTGSPSLARGEALPRELTFVAGDVSIELELATDAVQGQVVPPGADEIELQVRDGGSAAAAVDEVGWFRFDTRPVGWFRLRLRTADGARVVTAWTAP
jgi:hypothetical protein